MRGNLDRFFIASSPVSNSHPQNNSVVQNREFSLHQKSLHDKQSNNLFSESG